MKVGGGAVYTYGWCVCRSQMWVMPFILFTSLVLVLTFIAGCMLSMGLNTWCKRLVDDGKHAAKRYVTNQFSFLTPKMMLIG